MGEGDFNPCTRTVAQRNHLQCEGSEMKFLLVHSRDRHQITEDRSCLMSSFGTIKLVLLGAVCRLGPPGTVQTVLFASLFCRALSERITAGPARQRPLRSHRGCLMRAGTPSSLHQSASVTSGRHSR